MNAGPYWMLVTVAVVLGAGAGVLLPWQAPGLLSKGPGPDSLPGGRVIMCVVAVALMAYLGVSATLKWTPFSGAGIDRPVAFGLGLTCQAFIVGLAWFIALRRAGGAALGAFAFCPVVRPGSEDNREDAMARRKTRRRKNSTRFLRVCLRAFATSRFQMRPLTPTLSPEYRGEGVRCPLREAIRDPSVGKPPSG